MNKKIILADDDEEILITTKMILEKHGYTVTAYPDASPIIANEFEVPDLFILDKQLRGIDGLDICRFLKSQPSTSKIPVVICSANPDLQLMATDAGADGFLEKPFTISQLKQVIEKHMAKLK